MGPAPSAEQVEQARKAIQGVLETALEALAALGEGACIYAAGAAVRAVEDVAEDAGIAAFALDGCA